MGNFQMLQGEQKSIKKVVKFNDNLQRTTNQNEEMGDSSENEASDKNDEDFEQGTYDTTIGSGSCPSQKYGSASLDKNSSDEINTQKPPKFILRQSQKPSKQKKNQKQKEFTMVVDNFMSPQKKTQKGSLIQEEDSNEKQQTIDANENQNDSNKNQEYLKQQYQMFQKMVMNNQQDQGQSNIFDLINQFKSVQQPSNQQQQINSSILDIQSLNIPGLQIPEEFKSQKQTKQKKSTAKQTPNKKSIQDKCVPEIAGQINHWNVGQIEQKMQQININRQELFNIEPQFAKMIDLQINMPYSRKDIQDKFVKYAFQQGIIQLSDEDYDISRPQHMLLSQIFGCEKFKPSQLWDKIKLFLREAIY